MPVRRPARPAIRFDGTVHRVGDRTLVLLPADASAGLPSRGQVAVEGTVAGRPLVTVAEPDGRRGHWLGLDEELWYTPDWDLWLKLGEHVPVAYDPQPATAFRVHGTSLTMSGTAGNSPTSSRSCFRAICARAARQRGSAARRSGSTRCCPKRR